MVPSCRKARVIPEDDLADMYYEMLMSDQWISSKGMTKSADTHYVYKPILEKYGYNSEDFRYTLAEYIKDPESYAKVFTKVKEMMDARIDELVMAEDSLHKSDSLRSAIDKQMKEIAVPVLYKDILTGFFPTDTVCPGPDSLRYTINIPVLDTMFAGPAILLRNDTTAVNDTLSLEDMTMEDPRAGLSPVPGRGPSRGPRQAGREGDNVIPQLERRENN